MKILIPILLVFIFIFGLYYYLTGYPSAFEADQKCNSILSTSFLEDDFHGCDHDLETRQWILYEKRDSLTAARVLKRFRY